MSTATTLTTAYASIILDPAGTKMSPIVLSADIHQEDNAHDIAVLKLRGVDPTTPVFQTGTPVQITYGWNPNSTQNFYGYVNHVEPEHHHKTIPSLATLQCTLVCVGASYGMRNGSTRAWTNAQASSIVQDLIKSFFLSGVVEVGDPVWPQISNPGISTWQFLMSLADRLGRSLAVNQTSLRFMSLEKIMQQSTATIPTFWTRVAAPDASYATLSSFRALQGETAQVGENSKAIRIVSNVDRLLGKFTVSVDPFDPLLGASSPAPAFRTYETGVPSGNAGIARESLVGKQRDNRFYIQAEAVVAGNVKVTQGMPVLLLGLGSMHEGLWYVQSVVHRIHSSNYISELSLGRDAVNDTGQRPVRPPDQKVGITDQNAFSASPPQTVLVNGGWRAAFNSVVTV